MACYRHLFSSRHSHLQSSHHEHIVDRTQKMTNKTLSCLLLATITLVAGCSQSRQVESKSDSLAGQLVAAPPPPPQPLSSNSAQTSRNATLTDWRPSWNTAPEKGKSPKSILVPTVSFVDQGFRGSPSREQGKWVKDSQQKFIEAFRKNHECFGVTLALTNPAKSDFGLQYFEGIDGRTGRYQWVLYRMDTLGAVASGEGTGVQTTSGLDGAAQSVCSSIRNTLNHQGGKVEE